MVMGAAVRRRRLQTRRSRHVVAAMDSFMDVIQANASPSKEMHESAQDKVFHWLGRGPKPRSACFEALQKYFPGALPGAAVHLRSKTILEERFGMNSQNTLLGTSFCPDEINNNEFDLPTLMRNYWGNVFPMGGIGGSPYVGETGFKAFSSHVSEDGNIVVVFGPHVGISEDGTVGSYQREGQSKMSTACGAVVGAYNACLAAEWDPGDEDIYDMQMDELKAEFSKHAQAISETENPMASSAYAAFYIVLDRIRKVVNTKFGSGKLVLIGGIQINMPHALMDDHFLPIVFEVQQAGQETEDLIESFSNAATQQDLTRCPWAAQTAHREVFSFMTWSPPADSPVYQAMHKYFPGALPSQALHERKRAILRKFGFTSENTIMATSLCPDEINNDPSDLPVIMQSHWGDVFPMGGISGAPFVGKTGFKAFSSHVPDDGNIIILFGPHVGISQTGEVGACMRDGQNKMSTACGAVVGAYYAALRGDTSGPVDAKEGSVPYDRQMDWVKSQIAPHAKALALTDSPMASLAHQSYRMVADKMFSIINNDFGSGWLCLVGCIQINMPAPLEDHFYPYTFELRKAGEPTIDLLHELKEFN
eukprot:TRINITY_DN5525_c0_g2_i1.p1 TRINITY_DN5525_c0_g2~~TRINITY_DN5525_c0_g2_i1.p1  ORF type:complete len:688 (+),score=106.48 TRINITY_DN5525_c0_g2_i1:289-2064(+)